MRLGNEPGIGHRATGAADYVARVPGVSRAAVYNDLSQGSAASVPPEILKERM